MARLLTDASGDLVRDERGDTIKCPTIRVRCAVSALSDAERMALAQYVRRLWYGPVEHEACAAHPWCIESYMWTWRGQRTDIMHGDVELVARCPECTRDALCEHDSETCYDPGCACKEGGAP